MTRYLSRVGPQIDVISRMPTKLEQWVRPLQLSRVVPVHRHLWHGPGGLKLPFDLAQALELPLEGRGEPFFSDPFYLKGGTMDMKRLLMDGDGADMFEYRQKDSPYGGHFRRSYPSIPHSEFRTPPYAP